MTRPWPAGTSTGLGSLPGVDPVEACRLVVGEAPDLPYLPELPARGLGADLVGRTAAMLVDLAVEWQPHGWTVTSRPGRDGRLARDLLRWDMDAFTEQAAGAPVVKVAVCGPITLAANIELASLHKLISDHGALAELSASLAEGVRLHLDELSRRMPGSSIVLQVDEPSLPAALAGRIGTPSGYGTVRSIDVSVARAAVASVLSQAQPGARVVHCCAAGVDVRLLRETGADAVALDLSLVGRAELDELGESVEAGVSLWLGLAPATDATVTFEAVRDRVQNLWRRLGFKPELLAESVVPTPACGLAGASLPYARRVMAVLAEVGRALVESR